MNRVVTHKVVKKMLLQGQPAENVEITVLVDLDAIASYIGIKAWKNRSKQSKALSGLVIVRARKSPY